MESAKVTQLFCSCQPTALACAFFSSTDASGSKVKAITPAFSLSSTSFFWASTAVTELLGSRDASMAPSTLSSLASIAVAILPMIKLQMQPVALRCRLIRSCALSRRFLALRLISCTKESCRSPRVGPLPVQRREQYRYIDAPQKRRKRTPKVAKESVQTEHGNRSSGYMKVEDGRRGELD